MTDIVLEVHAWHTQCGSCGYGRGGWAGGPAREGKPILRPDSQVCHGCDETFTHVSTMYAEPVPIAESEAA